MKTSVPFLLIAVITLFASCDAGLSPSSRNGSTVETVQKELDTVRKKGKQMYDAESLLLEKRLAEKEQGVANLPHVIDEFSWWVESEKLKLENAKLREIMVIEKKVFEKMMEMASKDEVRQELEADEGVKLQRKELATNKSIAENDGKIRDYEYKEKSRDIERDTQRKLDKLEIDTIRKKTELKYH